MAFFKDDGAVGTVPLAPAFPYTDLPGESTAVGRLGRTYNRIGGLIDLLATKTSVETAAVLAVWSVESSGVVFVPGRPILRIELHKLFEHWGDTHVSTFDRHFRFGGHGIDGRPWQKHQWRRRRTDEWQFVHVDSQDREYEVFDFAAGLAGAEKTALSSSFGGPQILGSNHAGIGYASAAALFEAFKTSERWHVCGFFDFANGKSLLDEMRNKDWEGFARGYNGASNAVVYGERIETAYDVARELADLPRETPGEDIIPPDLALFHLDRSQAHSLNLRTGPKPAPVVAVVNEGHTLRKLAVHPDEPVWWQFSVEISGANVEGWANSGFLLPGPAPATPQPSVSTLPESHMRQAGHKRSQESGRAFPLDESNMPFRRASDADDKATEIIAITKYLDPGKTAHKRYQPGRSTFCNIYAYDFAYLSGVFLPRTWWTDGSLSAIRAGRIPEVVYGETVRELNANSLFDWFVEFGAAFGWSRAFDIDALQAAANTGDVCIIVAQRTNLNESGHIVAVIPEHSRLEATRRDGKVVQAVESQAGRENFRAKVQNTQWWRGSRFRDFAFWRHA